MPPTPAEPIVLQDDDVVVHVEYEQLAPIPNPETWTRFVCISDTHNRKFDVPWGDVLLHSGDLTNTGTYEEFKETMEWICSLPHKLKIIIAGNHDLSLHQEDGWYDENFMGWGDKEDINLIKPLLTGLKAAEAGVVYAQDERIEFEIKPGGRVWSLYGSPWSPEFGGWAFNYFREDELVSKFPKTDILLTHGPPLHIFDQTVSGCLAGCRDLANRLPYLRPCLHLFGHIHEAHGAYLHTWDRGQSTTPQVQSVDQPYRVIDADKHRTGIIDFEEPLALPEGGERTVFVNAANWPMGPRIGEFKNYKRQFGGPGFRPVVVDLKD